MLSRKADQTMRGASPKVWRWLWVAAGIGVLEFGVGSIGTPARGQESTVSFSDVFTSGSVSVEAETTDTSPSPASESEGRPLSEAGARVLLDDARARMQAGKVAEARAIFGEVHRRYPGGGLTAEEALLGMAWTAETAGQAELYLKELQLSGASALDVEAARIALEWSGRGGGLALAEVGWVLAVRSGHPGRIREAAMARARAFESSGRLKDAQGALEEAVVGGWVSEDADWLRFTGDIALKEGNLGRSRDAYERLVAKFPGESAARESEGRLGLLLELAGQSEKAVEHYRNYLSMSRERADADWVQKRYQGLSAGYFPPVGGGGVRNSN